ncbi:aminopeptidase P family protein [Ramlibacter sp. AW1]|uniref:Aminopeptidase P family protein n=1 Tax=Ramlibacter aurantiacus TaxID=2801330 RepID=A0A937D5F6_9BURK|nr:Xaa-Pro peptidase family protein [Ramlibacter aurantiacus]MBL0422660.1 aminopeptidase P family protein [Ramlibacter aurantiacus]
MDVGRRLAEEREQRLRTAMQQAGLQALVVAGDAWRSDYLRYAVDLTPMEGLAVALVVPGAATRVFVEHPAEARRIAAELPGCSVGWHADPQRSALEAVAALAFERVGLAPAPAAPALLARSLGAQAPLATRLMDELMVRKSPLEADAVARATALADEGYDVFRRAAVPGKREFELIAELEAWFRSRGCAENFMIMGSGGTEVRTMRPPGDRVLQPGDLVTTELTPCVDGYYAQICRTRVIGEPTAVQRAAYAVFEQALDAGIAAVRPGATHGDVARAQNDVFRAHGLGEYVTSQYTRVRGHGMGLFVDGVHVLEDVPLVLEPDMTLIVHPNTYHPQAGYIVLGDTVRVTADGCQVLTRTTRSLAQLSRGGS